MIGRVAYSNPWLFADVDRQFYGEPNPGLSRREVIEAYADYCAEEQAEHDVHSSTLLKPAQCMMNGCRGNKQWRQHLDVHMRKSKGKHIAKEVLLGALELMDASILDERAPKDDFDGVYERYEWELSERNSVSAAAIAAEEAKAITGGYIIEPKGSKKDKKLACDHSEEEVSQEEEPPAFTAQELAMREAQGLPLKMAETRKVTDGQVATAGDIISEVAPVENVCDQEPEIQTKASETCSRTCLCANLF